METNSELAWCVGFLESSGCFGAYENKQTGRYYPRMYATSQNREVVDRLADYFGGQVYPQRRAGKIVSWRWAVQDSIDTPNVMRYLRPYLSERRQSAVDAALASWNASRRDS